MTEQEYQDDADARALLAPQENGYARHLYRERLAAVPPARPADLREPGQPWWTVAATGAGQSYVALSAINRARA